MPRDRLRVLHITESLGAGVATAIQNISRALPEFHHHLVATVRSGEFSDDRLSGLSDASISKHRRSLPSSIGQSLDRVRPDIVHLHSSVAGGIYRSLWRTTRVPVVYSPHCFAFERDDLNVATRRAIRTVERALAARTTVLMACSPEEARQATLLGYRKVRYVPNAFSPHSTSVERRPSGGIKRVVTIGRLSKQKDPEYFRSVVAAMGQRGEFEYRWLGAGDDASVRTLHEAGIVTSGWLTAEQLRRELASASIYIHTAAWEGFPLSVLEAASQQVPVIVRAISAFRHLPANVQAHSPQAVADAGVGLLEDNRLSAENVSTWAGILNAHAPIVQRQALLDAYQCALERRISDVW